MRLFGGLSAEASDPTMPREEPLEPRRLPLPPPLPPPPSEVIGETEALVEEFVVPLPKAPYIVEGEMLPAEPPW